MCLGLCLWTVSGLVQKPERLERGDVVRSQLEREREARVRLLELPGGEVDCARGAHRLHVLGRPAERLVHPRLPVRQPPARRPGVRGASW